MTKTPTPCAEDDCTKPARTKGRCPTHYAAQRRRERGAKTRAPKQPPGQCALEGCDKQRKSRGLCPSHYEKARRGLIPAEQLPFPVEPAPTCSFEDCGNPIHSGGLCGGHAYQQRQGQELTSLRDWTRIEGQECSLEDCDREAAHLDLCQRHYQRKIEGDPDWARPIKAKAKNGEGHVGKDGYVHLYHDGRKVMEHRLRMEEVLGRRLLSTETVHHVNGVRHDNRVDGPPVLDERGRMRSGNLELWSHAQPPGQEVGPKLAFACEILALYGTPEQQALAKMWAAEYAT